MATGTVKWFDPDKGYGFVSHDDGATELCVHSSAIQDGNGSLEANQRVEFEVTQGPKGAAATNVRSK